MASKSIAQRAVVFLVVVLVSVGAIATPPATAAPESERERLLAEVTAALADAPEHMQIDRSMLSQLTAEELLAVPVEYVQEEPSIRSLNSGCLTADGGYLYSRNAAGNNIWRWKATQRFCWNSPEVTSVSAPIIHQHVYEWADALGWSYDGLVQAPNPVDYYAPEAPGIRFDTLREGKFEYCPPRIFCLDTAYPRYTYRVYGTGEWSSTARVN